MKTFIDIVLVYSKQHNFNKTLGVTKIMLVTKLCAYFEDKSFEIGENLKIELKRCDNLNQMINVIEVRTKQLSKERDAKQLEEFENQLQRIIKFARL